MEQKVGALYDAVVGDPLRDRPGLISRFATLESRVDTVLADTQQEIRRIRRVLHGENGDSGGLVYRVASIEEVVEGFRALRRTGWAQILVFLLLGIGLIFKDAIVRGVLG